MTYSYIMEGLLRNVLTAHYTQPPCTTPNLVINTSEVYFELEDVNQETVLSTLKGTGTAAFVNNTENEIGIINYDKFLTSLPYGFQEGRSRCDLILHTKDNYKAFLLAELKDRRINRSNRSKARKEIKGQLTDTLDCISAVAQIQQYIDQFTDKRCCYFNKQPKNPSPSIRALTAFNMVNRLLTNGACLKDPVINGYGFEYWEYYEGAPYCFT